MITNLSRGLILVVVGAIIHLSAGDVRAKGCMSGGCHQGLVKVKYMHGPVAAEMAGVDACTMCHAPAGAECSADRAGNFKMKTKGMCSICHARGTSTMHSEKEIEAKCLNCHDPHGSDLSRYLLRAGHK